MIRIGTIAAVLLVQKRVEASRAAGACSRRRMRQWQLLQHWGLTPKLRRGEDEGAPLQQVIHDGVLPAFLARPTMVTAAWGRSSSSSLTA